MDSSNSLSYIYSCRPCLSGQVLFVEVTGVKLKSHIEEIGIVEQVADNRRLHALRNFDMQFNSIAPHQLLT
jgi:hypothetical protein